MAYYLHSVPCVPLPAHLTGESFLFSSQCFQLCLEAHQPSPAQLLAVLLLKKKKSEGALAETHLHNIKRLSHNKSIYNKRKKTRMQTKQTMEEQASKQYASILASRLQLWLPALTASYRGLWYDIVSLNNPFSSKNFLMRKTVLVTWYF